MGKEPEPATTLKQRNRWLSFAEEQEGFAQRLEADAAKPGAKYQWKQAIAHHRASAAKYRAAAAAYRPVIEGEQ